MRSVSLIAKLQGIYWTLTGVWPLLHMPSFLWVTGPKTDLWLVRTVGILIAVVGLVLLVAGFRQRVTSEVKWLGISGAAGLGFVSAYYPLRNVIWDIYLLDAVAELIIILLWLWAGQREMAKIDARD
ncbi:hypothetical protein I0P70_20760 [Pontibacter sp. FD36]|uniref:hypothetical protein n=1 Tax=Pontibacter sp. FD36 TaxID=2789860 RepID=UPI0018A92E65|nr:hypothetical protein [Pontibacter sp. FD36]MBF8965696.1 hypothetical protein [Pontibacter sp. FD36]